MTRETILISTIVELADNLVDEFDLIDVLTVLCHRCVNVLDVDAVGVLLATPRGELQYVASSSESMRVLELLQLQAAEGPCVDTYKSGAPVIDEQLRDSYDRWPVFAPRAVEYGFNSAHSFPMRLRGQTIGALNLFRSSGGPLNETDVTLAQGLADVATIAIIQHRSSLDAKVLNDQLSFALNSRIIIEQAKGMVSQATSCDMDEAFVRMRTHARNHNLKLTEVSRMIVESELSGVNLDEPTSRH